MPLNDIQLKEITFEIPLKPVSGKGARANRFREAALKYIPLIDGGEFKNHHKRYSAKILFYYQGECNGDMDNRLLSVFDAIKGRTIYDDFQIKELYCAMVEFSDRTAVRVTLKEIQGRPTKSIEPLAAIPSL